jgi:rRNA biogenesis protein RRP5
VIEVNSADRRVTLTLKQGLIRSKLPPLASSAEAAPGRRAHGCVTGVTDHGVFVEFYGGLKGLVPPSEAPAADGADLATAYSVGQVVRCTVLGVDPRRGVRLSLVKSAKVARESAEAGSATAATAGALRGDEAELGGLRPGDIVADATVTRVVHATDDAERVSAVYLLLRTAGGASVTARLPAEHLSDHAHAAEVLAGALKPGAVLPEVLILDLRPQAHLVIATRKATMLDAAREGRLPCALADLQPGQRVAGFVASVTSDACFVRFGGTLTGRAGLPALSDIFITDPSAAFEVGQTVQAVVGDVDVERERFGVILKPSQTGMTDSALLATYFRCAPAYVSLQSRPLSNTHRLQKWRDCGI